MIRKKVFIIIAAFLMTVFISACDSDNQNSDTDNNSEKQVANKEENNANDNNNDDENNEKDKHNNDSHSNNEKNTSVENNENDSKLTKDEAKEKVVNYIKENEPEIEDFLDTYQFVVEKKDDKYQVNMFSAESDDENIGSPLLSSYKVNRETGEVDEVESEEANETDPYYSEIVDLSKEEQRARHKEIAVQPDNLSDEVYEHLLLPGIHENTKDYSGRVNPGNTIMFEFPDAKDIADRSTKEAEVSEDGYFTIHVNPYEFKEGQKIRVYITNGYPHEQTFDIPVHKDKKGMEDIRVKK